MKNVRIALLAIVLLSAACTDNNEQTLSGTITNAEGQKISLIGFPQGQPDTLASTVLTASGKFSFPVEAGTLAFYNLNIGDSETIVLAFDSTQSFVVTADFTTIRSNYNVSNSKDSKDLRDHYVQSYSYETALDSTMKALQQAAESQDNDARIQLSKEYNEIRLAYKNYIVEQIETDSTNIGNFSSIQRLNPDEDWIYILKIRNGLSPRLKGNIFFDQMANQVAQ